MAEHRNATQIHKGRYIQTSDPGAVGAGVEWLDTNTTPAIHKKRNAGDSGWDTVLDPSTYATLASPALTGNPTAPTQSAGNNSTRVATTAYTDAAIAALVGTAPGVLDTLGEISDAINDDANLYTTLTTALALKAPLASPVFTGNPTAPTPSPGDNDTSIATTAFVAAAVAAGGAGVTDGDKGDIVVSSSGSVWSIDSSVALPGNPTTTTQTAGNNSTRIATTAYVDAAVGVGSGISASLVDAKGDLIVGTANDTVARLAAGPNGSSLITDSAATGGVKWAIDGGVDLSGADDYIFNAAGVTSLPSGYAWEQQGTSTYREEFGRGSFIFDPSAFNYLRHAYRSLPGTFNSVLIKFTSWMGSGNGGPGLILRNSSSGKLCHFGARTTGNVCLTFFSAASSGSVGTDVSVASPFAAPMQPPTYMKIVRNSSSSWDFLIGPSPNALFAHTGHTAVNVPSATQGFTPDQIGFGYLCIPASARLATVEYIKFT